MNGNIISLFLSIIRFVFPSPLFSPVVHFHHHLSSSIYQRCTRSLIATAAVWLSIKYARYFAIGESCLVVLIFPTPCSKLRRIVKHT